MLELQPPLRAPAAQTRDVPPTSRPERRRRSPGATSVESLIVLALVALGLVGAFTLLQSKYAQVVRLEGIAVETLRWNGRDLSPELGSMPPPPPAQKDRPAARPPKKNDSPWKSALDFAIDLTPIGDIKTLMDPNASGFDKGMAIFGLATSFLPGIGQAARVATTAVKVAKAAKAVDRAADAVDDARDIERAAEKAEDGADVAGAGKKRRGDDDKPDDKPDEEAEPGKKDRDAPPKRERMEQHDDCFKRNPKHDEDEFVDQLKTQEEGLNELTVDQFLENRDLFKSNGRRDDPSQQAVRDQVRAELEQDLVEHLLAGTERTPQQIAAAQTDAKGRIDKTMQALAALHNPDQIGGGGLGAEGVGDKGVNSSLGSQWKNASPNHPGLTRAEALEQAARRVPAGERGGTLLNVDFAVCP
jgi:hypothetical protein